MIRQLYLTLILFFRTSILLRGVIFWVVVLSCSEGSDPDLAKQTFTSIFDQSEFSSAYYPIDMKQTADGGFLILAERHLSGSAFRGTYLIKADEYGNFLNEANLDHYANPVGDLMEVDGHYYFFAMDTISFRGQLIRTDLNAESVEMAGASPFTYPAAASQDGKTLLLLSYDHADKTSVLSAVNTSGEIVKGPVKFSIGTGDDVEEPIMGHILHTGRRFPFQIGKVSEGLYFYNGFQNYTFSLVFTDLENESPRAVVHGQQEDGGFSAVVPLANVTFAAARFNYGDNYILPRVDLQTNGPSVSTHLGGFVFPELIDNAPVKILRTQIDGRKTLVYASETKSKQIALFFYDELNGDLISSRYLGFSNPFGVGNLIRTQDEGLAVCGTTWLAGRFPRICIFKISSEELAQQVD
jgi:hypothetical protein